LGHQKKKNGVEGWHAATLQQTLDRGIEAIALGSISTAPLAAWDITGLAVLISLCWRSQVVLTYHL
jgi:hypothetical protein